MNKTETIDIKIEIIGALHKTRGSSRFCYTIKRGVSVAELLTELGYNTTHQKVIWVAFNNEILHHSTILDSPRTLVLSVALGGG